MHSLGVLADRISLVVAGHWHPPFSFREKAYAHDFKVAGEALLDFEGSRSAGINHPAAIATPAARDADRKFALPCMVSVCRRGAVVNRR